ncbi:MAG: hypothetical protein H6741_17125 [Alphaproteobacteria bacterium]|nr:hypothetical protein [Alphaproteobacteria bacterium]MCB9794439.1 hypothetical protein [Alphaproteobacteria bacterium]
MLLLALSLACRPAAPPEPPSPPPEAGPPGVPAGEPTPPPPAPVELTPAGQTWTSASCHERQYERQIRINADDTYQASDLISPCPPDVTCVWSGVVIYSGTWEREGDTIVLNETEGGSADKTVNRLERLLWVGNQLHEPNEAGDCAYALMANLPKPPPPPPRPVQAPPEEVEEEDEALQ